MESSLPALERAREFVQTGDFHFLISPSVFQAEVFMIQGTILAFLVYISVKVSKL